ncbi:HAAS signaling domain-containing protein [Paenibacillus sp. MBLB4367]|uniref:HAAS signaling domain-containing protein n=1 Tax=Paenibacillus sp. MBLB4367 TaxID=3384767 RepID=UPI003907FB4A
MNKDDFLRGLELRLRGLPEDEQRRIQYVYEELFRQAEANGKSEQEIIAWLSQPNRGPEWMGVQAPPSYESYPTPPQDNTAKAMLVSIALGFFNLIFVLAPFLAICGVLFAFSLTSVLLIASPLFMLLGTGLDQSNTILLVELFGSLVLVGLGLLFGTAMMAIVPRFFRLTRTYIRANKRLIKGE